MLTRRSLLLLVVSLALGVRLIAVSATNPGEVSEERINEANSQDLKLADSTLYTPCKPYDSCSRRCVKDSISSTSYINVTLGHFNCYCDSDCEIFGDCCKDYKYECVLEEKPKPKQNNDNIDIVAEDFIRQLHSKPFECVVVDQFSKGSYWMVTQCAAEWPDDYTKDMCMSNDEDLLVGYLPVLGDTGWTYRNAYCAICNHVTNFYYWALNAKCVRSAPEEVLSGEPQMLSYYLKHFCTIELQQDLTFEKKYIDRNKTSNIQETVIWKKSLRPCEQDVIDYCPEGYSHEHVINLCASYQSIILIKDKSHHSKNLIFKNPACALCHGYHFSTSEIPNIQPYEVSNTTEESDLLCPIWLLNTHYDNAYWAIDANTESEEILPSFNKNSKTSSWAPPSFSILMRFQDNGEADITYDDEYSSSMPIPCQQTCSPNEMYDPFNGVCRKIICSDNMVFDQTGCVPDTTRTSSDLPLSVTVTIVFTFPPLPDNSSDVIYNNVTDDVVGVFENVFNSSAENITVTGSDNQHASNENDDVTERLSDDSTMSVSFVLLEIGNYTNDDFLKVIEYIKSVVNFEELLIEMEKSSIVVMQTTHPNSMLNCDMIAEYTSGQYSIDDYDGRKMLYVNMTDSYYLEDEFEMMDWEISVSKDEIETTHIEDSRVMVCQKNTTAFPALSSCDTYTSLNSSEYIVLQNGSLWLDQINVLIPPEEYIVLGDEYAVCIDDYLGVDKVPDKKPRIQSQADVIISWVTFGLTLLSLVCLAFTFLTYCLFSKLRSIPGWCIMNLTVALFAALLTFSIGASWTKSEEACTAIAVLLHYLFLATFFWNNIMAFDVWFTFGRGMKQTLRRCYLHNAPYLLKKAHMRRLVLKYMVYGWGMPALTVAICTAIEFSTSENQFGYVYDPRVKVCWITNTLSNLLAFGLPLALILFSNTIFFVLAIISIRKVSLRKQRHSSTTSIESRKRNINLQTEASRRKDTSISGDDVFASQETNSDTKSGTVRTRLSISSNIIFSKKSRNSVVSTKSSLGAAKVNIFIYIKMSTVMGFTWAFGFLSALFPDLAPLRYVFEISVPLQGVFILFAFIFKKRTLKRYKNFFRRDKPTKYASNAKNPRKSRDDGHIADLKRRRKMGVSGTNIPSMLPNNQSNNQEVVSRNRICSISSCDGSESHDNSICHPLHSRIQEMRSQINYSYHISRSEVSRSSSESTYDDKL